MSGYEDAESLRTRDARSRLWLICESTGRLNGRGISGAVRFATIATAAMANHRQTGSIRGDAGCGLSVDMSWSAKRPARGWRDHQPRNASRSVDAGRSQRRKSGYVLGSSLSLTSGCAKTS